MNNNNGESELSRLLTRRAKINYQLYQVQQMGNKIADQFKELHRILEKTNKQITKLSNKTN